MKSLRNRQPTGPWRASLKDTTKRGIVGNWIGAGKMETPGRSGRTSHRLRGEWLETRWGRRFRGRSDELKQDLPLGRGWREAKLDEILDKSMFEVGASRSNESCQAQRPRLIGCYATSSNLPPTSPPSAHAGGIVEIFLPSRAVLVDPRAAKLSLGRRHAARNGEAQPIFAETLRPPTLVDRPSGRHEPYSVPASPFDAPIPRWC